MHGDQKRSPRNGWRCAGVAGSGSTRRSSATGAAELEQHESCRRFPPSKRPIVGVVFHCATSQGKSVDVTLTVCTPEIVRLQMCPDPDLKNVKGLLDIKEDWPAVAFTRHGKARICYRSKPVHLRIEFQKNPWKYVVYDKQGAIVLQEHVKDVDTQGNFRGLPARVHHRRREVPQIERNFRARAGRKLLRLRRALHQVQQTRPARQRMGRESLGRRHRRHAQADSVLYEHRRLRYFREHHLPHALRYGQPLRGFLYGSDRRPAPRLLHHLRPHSQAGARSLRRDHRLARVPSEGILRRVVSDQRPHQGRRRARGNCEKIPRTRLAHGLFHFRDPHGVHRPAGRAGHHPASSPPNSASLASRWEFTWRLF